MWPGPRPASAGASNLDGDAIECRHAQPTRHPHEHPGLNNLRQVPPTGLGRGSRRDDSAQALDGGRERVVVNQTVLRAFERPVHVVRQCLHPILARRGDKGMMPEPNGAWPDSALESLPTFAKATARQALKPA